MVLSMMKRIGCFLLGVAALAGMTAAIAQPAADEEPRGVEIRIDLPADGPNHVTVIPGANRVTLELPRGSVFPVDVVAASGGLLRGARVDREGSDRLRLELLLARGLLDRVDYRPDAVVLRFLSKADARPAANGAVDAYLMGPDDKLLISVHGQEKLTSALTIGRDGMIPAPLVGDIQAAGLSPTELALRLEELLARSFLVDPQVFVDVQEFASQWVMIDGEVRSPGRVALRGGTRLKEVLSEAGGFNDLAGELISIARRLDDGGFVQLEVGRPAFEAGDSNPVLWHGDIITVGRATYCYVQGEVNSPNRVKIERGTTLLRAITLVGGLTEWANKKEVKILYGDGIKPLVVNLKHVRQGKQPDPVLRGGEIIVVERRFF